MRLFSLASVVVVLVGCKPSKEEREEAAKEAPRGEFAEARAEAEEKFSKQVAKWRAFEKDVSQVQTAIDELVAQKDKAVSELLAAKTEGERTTAQARMQKLDEALLKKRDALKKLRDAHAPPTWWTQLRRD